MPGFAQAWTAEAAVATWARTGHISRCERFESNLGGGEREDESAAAGEFAFGTDGAGVGAHDVFGDGEAEAGSPGLSGAGFVDAVEAFEEAGQVFGGDAGAERD